jgi:hypothetical protein
MLAIKPHHLLDIFKLYGAGFESFVPDPLYGHDFYKVGNLILKNPNVLVKFTSNSDDICKPCKYNINDKCSDVIQNNPKKYLSKNLWNKTIDTRLMEHLSISEGTEMTAIDYCNLALKKLDESAIKKIWKERPAAETKNRVKLLRLGLTKFSNKI